MDDALGVRGAERVEHLGREPREATERQRRARDACSTIAASGAPSRYSMMMYGRPSGSWRQIEHVDDALVADQVDRLRLGEEPLDEIAAIAALARQHLDRDAAADRRVHALVDAAHAADAEQARDAIRADRRAEQQVLTDRERAAAPSADSDPPSAASPRTPRTRTWRDDSTGLRIDSRFAHQAPLLPGLERAIKGGVRARRPARRTATSRPPCRRNDGCAGIPVEPRAVARVGASSRHPRVAIARGAAK